MTPTRFTKVRLKCKAINMLNRPLILRFLVVLLVVQSSYAESNKFEMGRLSQNLPKYITLLPLDAAIDWSRDICAKETITFLPENKKIAKNCKAINDSVYLKGYDDKALAIKGFLPIQTLDLGVGLGLHLYSDSNVSDLLISFDQNGKFNDYYLLDGEPLLDKTETALYSPGILFWYSHVLNNGNLCADNIVKGLGMRPEQVSFLYLHSPIQIKFIDLRKTNAGNNSALVRKQALIKLMNEAIAIAISRNDDDPELIIDFKQRLLVFIVANAPDKNALKYLINKYKLNLGDEYVNVYEKTKSCH